MSCAQIAVCAVHRLLYALRTDSGKMAVSSIGRGISEKSASGVFLKQAFFCYTELLKSILPPFPTLRAFEHCVLPGV